MENHQGFHMMVAAFDVFPYFTYTRRSGNITYGGLNYDILNWLAQYTKIQLSFVDIGPHQLENGVIPLTNLLIKKVVEFVPMLFPPKLLELDQQVDFTYPVAIQYYRFMMPYPEKEESSYRFSAVLRPFNSKVWFVIIASIISMILLLCLHQRYHPALIRHNISSFLVDKVGRNILFAISIFSGRSGFGNYFVLSYKSPFSLRIMIGLCVLMLVILVNSYITVYISYLTVSKFKPIVKSFEELAASKEYHVMQVMNSAFANFLMNTTTEPYKTLGNSLKKKPEMLFNFNTGPYNAMLKYNVVYAQQEAEIQFRIGFDLKRNGGQCRFTASPFLNNNWESVAMAMQKGYRHKKEINNGMMHLWEIGLVQYWFSKYVPNIDKCLIKDRRSLREEVPNTKPLTTIQLSGAFSLLIGGLSLSILCFVIENILGYLKHKGGGHIINVD